MVCLRLSVHVEVIKGKMGMGREREKRGGGKERSDLNDVGPVHIDAGLWA
jgi:hypothetical protein